MTSRTLDDILDEDPLNLSRQDLTVLVAYYRNRRASADQPKAKKDTGPKQKIDLGELGVKKPTGPQILRRPL